MIEQVTQYLYNKYCQTCDDYSSEQGFMIILIIILYLRSKKTEKVNIATKQATQDLPETFYYVPESDNLPFDTPQDFLENFFNFKAQIYKTFFDTDKHTLKRYDTFNKELSIQIKNMPNVNYRKKRTVKKLLSQLTNDDTITKFQLGKVFIEIFNILPKLDNHLIWNTPNGSDLDIILRYTKNQATVITSHFNQQELPACYAAQYQGNNQAQVYIGNFQEHTDKINKHYDHIHLGDDFTQKELNQRQHLDLIFNNIQIILDHTDFNYLTFLLHQYNSETIDRIVKYCQRREMSYKAHRLISTYDLNQTILIQLNKIPNATTLPNESLQQRYIENIHTRMQFIGLHEQILRAKDYYKLAQNTKCVVQLSDLLSNLLTKYQLKEPIRHIEMSKYAMQRGLFTYLDPALFSFMQDDQATANNAQPGSFVQEMFKTLGMIFPLDDMSLQTYCEYGAGFGSTAVYAVMNFQFSTLFENNKHMRKLLNDNLQQVVDKKKYQIHHDLTISNITSDIAFVDPLWTTNVEFSFANDNFKKHLFKNILTKHKCVILRVPNNYLKTYQYDRNIAWTKEYNHWTYLYYVQS